MYTIIFLIFCLFFIGLFLNPKGANIYIFLVTSFISLWSFTKIKKNFSLGLFFVDIYYAISMPFQMILAVFLPSWLVATRYNQLYDEQLFEKNDIMICYFILGTSFFFIATIICRVAEKFASKIIHFESPYKARNISTPLTLLFLLITCILHIVEIRLDANGFIDYAIRGISLFLLGQIVVKCSSREKIICLKNIILILLAVFIYGLPHILIGMRRDFILGFVYSFSFLLLIDYQGVKNYIKKHFMVFILLCFVFLGMFSLITTIKFGDGIDNDNNVFYLIIRRMTGLFDGSTILDYLKQHNVNLDFKNFLGVALNEQRDHSTGYRANQYYTFFIQGYPTNDQTGSAAPAFISALFYGPIGWFFIIVYISILNGYFSRKALAYFKMIKNGCCDYSIMMRAFIMIFAIHICVISYMMGGNYEAIKLFSPIVLSLVLIDGFSIFFSRFAKPVVSII